MPQIIKLGCCLQTRKVLAKFNQTRLQVVCSLQPCWGNLIDECASRISYSTSSVNSSFATEYQTLYTLNHSVIKFVRSHGRCGGPKLGFISYLRSKNTFCWTPLSFATKLFQKFNTITNNSNTIIILFGQLTCLTCKLTKLLRPTNRFVFQTHLGNTYSLISSTQQVQCLCHINTKLIQCLITNNRNLWISSNPSSKSKMSLYCCIYIVTLSLQPSLQSIHTTLQTIM